MMTNPVRLEWIRSQLESALQPTFLTINDDSAKHIGHEGAKNGGGHFSIEISSSHFEQKPIIECHRMIYSALTEVIPSEIHALKIKICR